MNTFHRLPCITTTMVDPRIETPECSLQSRYLAVLVIRRVEAVQKLPETLVLRPLPTLVLGVVLHIVHVAQILNCHYTIARLVQLPERQDDQLATTIVHWGLKDNHVRGE